MSIEQSLTDFLEESVSEEGLNEEYFLCPEGDYPFSVKDWKMNTGTYKDSSGVEKAWASLSLSCILYSEELRESSKRDEVIVDANYFISLTDEGALDRDNNQRLARLFKIFYINPAGVSLTESLDSLLGQTGECFVSQTPMLDKAKEPLVDDEGEPRFRAEITKLTA